MRPSPRTLIALTLTAAFVGLLVTEISQEPPCVRCLHRTGPIRQNMARLQRVLMTVERHFESLTVVSETQQIALMNGVVGVLKEYLLPHLAAEEAVLYPAVDRALSGSAVAWTRTLRREHEILRRWIDELEAQANASLPDRAAFIRRGQRLLGLIEAHFEVDGEELLPVLDEAAQAQP